MSAENHSNGRAELPEEGASVLANLPRTRPQRATARRAAARRTGARPARPQPSPTPADKPAAKTEPAPIATAAAKTAPKTERSAKTSAGTQASAAKTAAPKTSAAKATAAKAAEPKAAEPKAAARTGASPRRERGSTARRQPRRQLEPVPRQGFESEGDQVSGPVQPFGATELIGAATEALGEIAKAGLSGGERLLKDALSLLSR